MRSGFVHEATLELAPGADERAPGAAVTVELCGHWEHKGACRWPHRTVVDGRSGQVVHIRTVFAADPGDEQAVRRGISQALRAGRLEADSDASRWTVVSDGDGDLRPGEAALAGRWADS
jgi:hypothetical protein